MQRKAWDWGDRTSGRLKEARGDESEKGICIIIEQRNEVTMAEIARNVKAGTSAVAMVLKQRRLKNNIESLNTIHLPSQVANFLCAFIIRSSLSSAVRLQ